MEEVQKFLIDSDVLIEFLRGVDRARSFLLSTETKGQLVISVVNVMEIYSGQDIKNNEKKEVIDNFLSGFEVIPLDEDLAKEVGRIRLHYQIPFADAAIAATAISLNAILVTKNIKHFSSIEGLMVKKFS